MSKSYYGLLLLIFTCQFTFSQLASEKQQTILTYLNELAYPEFSGSVLFAQNDSILFEKAYGFASLEYSVKNQTNTLFNIASITKTITAVATLELVDKGVLDLNAPIGKYLPDYPNKLVRDSVTTQQLLTHTSGLDNFLVEQAKNLGRLDLTNVEDYLSFFATKPLLFSPGTDYTYSASGYVVLGLLIEKLSGLNYHQYLTEHVFEKAGMENTLAIPLDSIVKNKASGYTSFFGETATLSKNDTFITLANPAGFYYSTAQDLLRFFDALKRFDLISESLTKTMISPLVKGYNTNYGYGMSVDKRWDQTIVGHSGGWYGVQCELMHFEEDEITVVILSNIDTAKGEGMNKVSNFIKHVLANRPLTN